MAEIKDPENTVIIELKDGPVVIELLADVAPKHAERMKELARAGAYDGVVFHRVLDQFMARNRAVEYGNSGGTTRRTATGGSELTALPAEFPKLPRNCATLAAACTPDPNSGQRSL